MFRLHFLGFITLLAVIYLQSNVSAHPQPQQPPEEEDYASYATLYPEIAKKIGEEPIEIIDVVKAVLVYDSDDATPSPAEETTDPDSEVVNSSNGQTETFQRLMKKQN